MIERDPWDPPAELVATHEPDLTAEEWVAIRDEIWDKPWNDQHRFPDLLVEAVKVLGEIATGNAPDPARTATQGLREMVYRAHVGAWRHERDTEPGWSLDPDPKQYRRGER